MFIAQALLRFAVLLAVVANARPTLAQHRLTLGPEAASALEAIASEGQPEGKNGWPILIEAGRLTDQVNHAFPPEEESAIHSGFYDWTVLTTTGLDDEHRRVASSGLNRIRESGAFDLAKEALSCPRFVQPAKADEPDALSRFTRDLKAIREIAKPLNASMSVAFQEGRWNDACEELQASLTLASAAARQPSALSYLVGLVTHTATLRELRTCVTEADIPVDVARRIIEILTKHPLPDPSAALRGERIHLSCLIEYTYSPQRANEGQSTEEILALYPKVGAVGIFLNNDDIGPDEEEDGPAVQFATRDEMLALADKVWPRIHEVMAMSCRESMAANEALDREIDGLADRYVLTRMIAEPWPGLIRSRARAEMEFTGTRILLALELFHAINNRWPESLDELPRDSMPGSLIDCTTGQLIRYKRLDDQQGFALYSVGADGIDNGGAMNRDNSAALVVATSGFDYILNTPRERHMMADVQHEEQ